MINVVNPTVDDALQAVLRTVKDDLSWCPISEHGKEEAFKQAKEFLTPFYEALDKLLPSKADQISIAAMTIVAKQLGWVMEALQETILEEFAQVREVPNAK